METILIIFVILVLLGFIPLGGRRRFSNNSLITVLVVIFVIWLLTRLL